MNIWRLLVLVAGLVFCGVTLVRAAAANEAIIPLEQYSTPKAKSLATLHRKELVEMNEDIHHCLPWLQVQPAGIGFRKPKGAGSDDRYLSVWVFIQQDDDAAFGAAPREARASAMFSRYGAYLLRRMASLSGPLRDPNLHGFSVVLSWTRPGSNGRGAQPVNETLALFVDKQTALGFLGRTVAPAEFVRRATFTVFDGKEDLGRLPLTVSEDSFLSSFQLANYTPPNGRKCS